MFSGGDLVRFRGWGPKPSNFGMINFYILTLYF